MTSTQRRPGPAVAEPDLTHDKVEANIITADFKPAMIHVHDERWEG